MIHATAAFFLKLFPLTTTKIIVWYFNTITATRPRRWSMRDNFTSWTGLTDLSYNGRHLDENPTGSLGPNPHDPQQLAELKGLYLRNGRPQQECVRTSVLFLFFAQWFTDSFLRTNGKDPRRTDSNHEIDFCALYGLTEQKTNMLRFPACDDSGNILHADDGTRVICPDRAHLLAFETGEKDGQQYPPKLYETFTNENGEMALRFRDQFKQNSTVTEEPELGAHGDLKVTPVTHYLHDPVRMKDITADQTNDQLKNYFAMGLEHGNGTLGYVVINILMLRAHNKLAEEIWAAQKGQPDWTKDRVFHVTRNVLTVILLQIVIEDYVAHISQWTLKTPIGVADKARWGKPNRIALEFNLLYRWHSLVPDTMTVDGKALDENDFRRMPQLAEEYGLETLLSAFSSQPAGRMGLKNYPDFFGYSKDPNKDSTLAKTLKIAYDAKLRSLNDYRVHYGLKKFRSIEELVGDGPGADALVADLTRLYGSIEHVDWFTGMLAEKHNDPVIMGQTMMVMVANDAFSQALTNPLLSKNIMDLQTNGAKAVFTPTGLRLIRDLRTMQDVSDYVLGPSAARCSFSY